MNETVNPYPPQYPPPAKKSRVGLVILFVVLGVVALCLVSGVAAIVALSDEEPTKTTEAGGTAPAVTESEPEAEPKDDTAKIGPDEWFEWSDGIEAQVTKIARKGSAGQWNVGDVPPDTPRVVVTVTVKNGTSDMFDASMATVNLYAGPNGESMEGLFQEEGFTGNIPRGKSATARYDFAVPAKLLGELRVEVMPSFEHAAAFFEGGL